MKQLFIVMAMLLIPTTVFAQSASLTMAELSLTAAAMEMDQTRGVSYEATDKGVRDMRNQIAKRVIAMRAENKSCLLIKQELGQRFVEKTASMPEAKEYPASVKKLTDAMADYAGAWCLDNK